LAGRAAPLEATFGAAGAAINGLGSALFHTGSQMMVSQTNTIATIEVRNSRRAFSSGYCIVLSAGIMHIPVLLEPLQKFKIVSGVVAAKRKKKSHRDY
jgi:translation elongation factor EF-1alpha